MKINRNFGKIPPGGWHFENYGTHIRAANPDLLIAAVELDRASRCLPLGLLEDEIARYLASFDVRFSVPGFAPPWSHQAEAEMVNRIWRYKLRLGRTADLRVQQRREICAACPHRRDFRFGPSTYEAESHARGCLLTSETDYDHLGSCSQYRWPLAIATRLEDPAKVALPGIVEGCWFKK